MKKFTVIWTYIANYGVYRNYEAVSAEDAARRIVLGFSEDFAERGSVFVFEGEPAFIYDLRLMKEGYKTLTGWDKAEADKQK